ncbi:Lipid A core - O-antigen ligase and related enzymes [Bacteroides eggerthii]|uniref:Lipid A core - O-antigen ligase and related enzymes n=2 Tax=Bacteroides eggerthii TaxID=28111 RepID=A0A380YJG6_9BACE|nr:hypothetical protein BACEGG_01710 [Bacteroides eggerthii DSM 20697]SUV28894.1 Lipid A core - O-antigen ligase and related enzymes [Bacteroides eggerthii]
MLNKYCVLFGVSFISNFIIAAELFSIPLESCSYYGLFFFTFLYLLICQFRINPNLNRLRRVILILFFTPILWSIFGVLVNSFLIDNIHYSFQVLMTGLPRLINYLLILILFLSFSEMDEKNSIRNIKWFYFALLVFLFFGLWQFFHFYFDIPIISFETRDMAHSVVGVGPTHRITSIAREPSFFSPLLVELFVLSLFFKELGWNKFLLNVVIGVTLFVSVFTLSPSTYMEFFFLFLIMIFRNKIKFSTIIVLGISSIIIISFFQYLNEFILYRLINVEDSTRFLLIETIIDTMSNMDIFTLLFGIGPKGLSYISEITTIDGTGEKVHSSTNNIFADLFVDNGLFGVLFLIILFVYLYRKAFSIKYSNLPALFFIHLFLCCQYRGNYSSVRFIILVAILIFLISFYKKKEQKYSYEG